MPTYNKGTKVRITFDAVVTNLDGTGGGHSPESYLLVEDTGTFPYAHAIYMGAVNQGDVKVEVLETPVENWPPQADDVWKSQSGIIYHFIGGQFHRRNNVYSDRTTAISVADMQSRRPVLLWRKFS